MVPTLFNITVAELTNMNTWIGTNCDANIFSKLTPDGYEQLCVMKAGASTTSSISKSTTASPTTSTSTSTGVPPPAPTQPGASTKCKKWHTVVDNDTCYDIANNAGITLDYFYQMNPGVGSNCGSLWKGYAVCIGE